MLKKIFKYDNNFYNRYEKESLKKIQISLIVILCFILLSVFLFSEPKLKIIYISITIIGVGVVFASIYYSSIRKYDKSVMILITSTVILSWFPYFFDPSIRAGDFIPIFYLVIPILLASIFVNTKRTILISAVQIIASFIMISSSSKLQELNWISYIIFFIIVICIAMISKYMYNKEINTSIKQGEKLQDLNEELEILN